MICQNCYNNIHSVVFKYDAPDKYEKLSGITEVERQWLECGMCGHYQSERSYQSEKLTYEKYRNRDFRGKGIEEEFESIMALPNRARENFARICWLSHVFPNKIDRVLDVGSGLGVFPYELRNFGCDVKCVEINKESVDFLCKLGLECVEPGENLKSCFDMVTMVHVLEHIEHPCLFLSDYSRCLTHNGKLFIEVPDAIEFGLLPKSHDEFNSCHFHFYTVPSLASIVERSGFVVKKIERCFHGARNLYRIRLLAEKR
jgi:SAM-dependent methyltransferase